jgi:hypothetical protein
MEQIVPGQVSFTTQIESGLSFVCWHEVSKWAAALGARRYLRKAFDVPALTQEVKRCLEVAR